MSNPYKGLVVEDDQASRQYLQLLLKLLEIEPVIAQNGEQALQMVNGHEFDILLLDIALGNGMNGMELCRELKSRPQLSDTPAIAVTAFARDSIPELESAGFAEYLSKPYGIEELKKVLRSFLQ